METSACCASLDDNSPLRLNLAALRSGGLYTYELRTQDWHHAGAASALPLAALRTFNLLPSLIRSASNPDVHNDAVKKLLTSLGSTI